MTNVSRLRSLSHCLICVCESLSDRAHPKINNEIGIYQVQVQMRKRDKKEKYPDAQLYRIVDRQARSKTTCLSSLVIHALLADHSLSTPCFCVCNRPSLFKSSHWDVYPYNWTQREMVSFLGQQIWRCDPIASCRKVFNYNNRLTVPNIFIHFFNRTISLQPYSLVDT